MQFIGDGDAIILEVIGNYSDIIVRSGEYVYDDTYNVSHYIVYFSIKKNGVVKRFIALLPNDTVFVYSTFGFYFSIHSEIVSFS